MRSSRHVRVACLLLAAACGRPPAAPPAPDASRLPPTGTDTTAATPPPAPGALQLFAVDVRAEGAFRPGEPVRIVTEVRSALPVDTAEVALVLPEVAAARASGWGEDFRHLPAGVRVPAADSAVGPVRPERPVRLETTLVFPAPGYYQVLASARVRAPGAEVERRGPVQDLATRGFWVWIAGEGGHAADEYDPTRLPIGADPQPGPLRFPEGTSRLRALHGEGRRDPTSHAVVEGTVRTPEGAPAAGVTVHVRGYVERCPGRPAAEETARADAAGRFRVRLRSYFPRAFAGCVATHADAPAGSPWRHASARGSVRFAGAGAAPDTLRVELSPGRAPAVRETPPGGTAAGRVARWMRESPGEPLPASVAFHAPLPDSTVLRLLERHRVRPYVAQAWAGDVAAHSSVPPDRASPAVVADARRQLVERLERSLCGVAGRVRARLADEAALGRPPGERSRPAREMLSRLETNREALPRVRAGAPTLWGLWVVGRAEDVARLGADPLVWAFEPAERVVEDGVERVAVTRPPEPEPVGRVEVRPEVAALTEQEVAARLERLAAEPRSCAPSAPRHPVRPPPGVGAPVVLAPGAAGAWRARELRHVPRYFQLAGWRDAGTLLGRAGCNPVEVRTDAPRYAAWDLPACGGAAPAPDGRLAWSDGRGAIRVGERGGAQRPVLDPGRADPGAGGDPSGLVVWSPDGRRILTSRTAEAGASYTVLDVATGARTPLPTRLPGRFSPEAWGWLDAERILFTAGTLRDSRGRPASVEGGGTRTDLAVLDLRGGGIRAVTAVPDSVFLRPLARWGGRGLLVGEAGRDRLLVRRWWIYDTRTWSRRPAPLPPGTDAVAADTTRVLVVRRAGDGARLLLWRGGGGSAEPLAEVRGTLTGAAWSPDGRRLAVGVAVEEPAAGMPGSFVTRYLAFVLEPRA